MSSKVKHIRSSVPGKVPAPEQLELGQIAVNISDGKVYIKKTDNTVYDITKEIFQNQTRIGTVDNGTPNLSAIEVDVNGVEVARFSEEILQFFEELAVEDAKKLTLKEATSSGVNGVSIKSPDSLADSYTLTMPAATGTLGQVMITDGAGQLSFRDSDIYGGNRIYVSQERGNDINDGQSAPVKTIKRALQLSSALVYTVNGIPNGKKIAIQVAAGDYSENNPLIVPDNVVVKGDGLRSCIIRPLNAGRDMLRVRNGSYFAEFTFRDSVDENFVPQFTFDYGVSFDDPTDTVTSRVGYTYLPESKPTITTSPYIQNCSLISFLGGNGVKIDGSLVNSPNIPRNSIEAENPVIGSVPEQGKSMVSNAFTMLSFGGTGWRVINNAYSQIVSCFQIFMLNGVYTQSGGYVSITNSATNFGLYSLRSSGYNPGAFEFDRGYITETGSSGAEQTINVIGLGRKDPVEEFVTRFRDPEYKYVYDLLYANKDLLTADTVSWINSQISNDISPFTSSFIYDEAIFSNNLHIVIDAVASDVYSGGNSKTIEVGTLYHSGFLQLLVGKDETIAALNKVRDLAQDVVSIKTSLSNYTGSKFDIVSDIVNDPDAAPEVVDVTSISDITNTYKPASAEFTFNAEDDIDIVTNIFTIIDHGFNNGDAVIYNSDGNTPVGGLDNEQTYYIKLITTDEFSLTFDDSLEFDVNLLSLGTSTHKLISDLQEFYVNEILESHSIYQELFLSVGTYHFVPGRLITGTTGSAPNSAYVYSYNAVDRKLVVSVNEVTIGSSTIRNLFDNTSFINQDHTAPSPVTSIGITGTASVVGRGSARFTISSTKTGGALTTTGLTEKQIWFHRPSVVNSSAHTWEYAGSGTDYNALPQNGGNTRERFEQFAELPGRVYTSGTNELGDFKVGDFITAYNRTGNITFRNKVTVDELDALRLSVSDVVINEISTNVNLGDDEIGGASHTRLSTQLSIRSFLSNRLGNFIDKSVSTNAVPGALVQLNTNGQINTDLIPATRAFQSTVSPGYLSRLLQVQEVPSLDLTAGDIATEEYEQVELTLDSTVSGVDGAFVIQATSGATGYLKGNYTNSLNVLVASIDKTFINPFDTTNTISIAGSPTGAIPTVIGIVSEIIENFFLRSSNESQFLKLDVSAIYSFTNASISSIARVSNISTIVTSAPHGLTATSRIKITCSNDTFNKVTDVTVINATTFSYPNTGADVSTISASGTVNSVVSAADSGAQGEITQLNFGVLSNVDNINITVGSGYTPAAGSQTYELVSLTSVTGSGNGAKADITVADGEVIDVDLRRGGLDYSTGDTLSVNSSDIGGTGSNFEIDVVSVEKRIFIDILGGELFVATAGSIDFIRDNNALATVVNLTDSLINTFNASTNVNTSTEEITITGHALTSGDPLTYSSSPNTPLGGMLNNNVYYAKVIDLNTIELYEDYSLLNKLNILSTGTGLHSLTRYTVNLTDDSFFVEAHGYTTGDAVTIKGNDLPTIEGIQIPQTGNSYFVGSLTVNSFTLHSLRSDALSSINGLTINPEVIETTGNSTATFTPSNVRVTDVVNTSSRNKPNWNSLAVTNIDAANIISGTISTSRLGSSGSANTDTFLRGDSSWSVAVQTLSENANSPLTLTGPNISGNYYGNVVLDIERVNSSLGDSLYTNAGVAKFLKTQFFVGTGIEQGQVYIRDGVIDAGTLDGFDSSYFLNPANLTSPVPVNRGGTNLSAYNTGDLIYAQTSGTLGTLSIGRPNSILTSTGTAPQWSTRLDVARDIHVRSGDVTTNSKSTAQLFDTNPLSVNIGGSASTIALGNTSSSILTSQVNNYEAIASTSVTVNLKSQQVTTNATSNNGDIELRFSNTTLIRVGQVITGSASIQANTVIVGVTANSAYISKPLTGSVASLTSLTFSETPVSIGVKLGDQIKIVSSGITNLNGTWPVTGADISASSITVRTASNVTAAQIPVAGTVEKLSSLLIRNTSLVVGSSEAGLSPTSATIKGENAVGNNVQGGDLTLQPGLSTGNAAGGDFIVSTGNMLTSSAVQQSPTLRLTIDNLGNSIFTTVVDVRNTVKANSSTGITTDQLVFPLINDTATTVNFAGAASAVNIGSASGTTTIKNNAVVDLDLQIKGGDLTTNQTTFNLINNTATAVNFAGEATALIVGATTGLTTIRNKLLVKGDLQVDGTTVTINSTNISIDDPIFNLGGDTAPVIDDNKDRGISFQWFGAGSAKTGFFGFDDSKNAFTFVPDGTINAEVVSGTVGQVYVGSINLNDHSLTTTNEVIGITSASATPVDSWSAGGYRSGKYTLQVTCTAGTDANSYQTSEILVIHNNSISTLTDYAVIRTGNNLVTFTTDISGGNVRILAQATTGNTIKVKLARTIQTI